MTAVGKLLIDEVWTRLCEVISHDNDAAAMANAPQVLETTGIPHALGFGDSRDRATFTVVTDAGEQKALELGPDGGMSLGSLGDEPKALPLWRQRRGENYWFAHVPEQQMVYLQYNRCADDPQKPFAQWVAEMEDAIEGIAIEGQEIATFLIDLRNNGGKPRSYGEIKFLELANSKLQASYSTKFFELAPDDALSVLPDIETPGSFAQWKEGRDPALEAIAKHRAACEPASGGR
ncbi:MAG: hypothetical protein EXS13_12695 [Planctomycetes bacterium]|nr:hypothetical protein [Planctomycetota bacterium]